MWRSAAIATLAISIFGGASWEEAWNWWRGEDAYHQQEYAESAEAYAEGQKAGTVSKIQSTLAYNEGTARYAAEDWGAAEDAFTRAATADPQHWKALYNKGNAQVQQGYNGESVTNEAKLREAIASYEAVLKIQPDDADAQHNLDYVKKLLEQQEQEQQQGENQDEQQEQQQQQDQQNQQQDSQSGEDQQSDEEQQQDGGEESEDQDSGSGGDQQEEQPGASGGEDQSEEQQPQSGQQPQEGPHGQLTPDMQRSQRLLDQLAEFEEHLQHNRGFAREPRMTDPWQQMTDPFRRLLGQGTTGSPLDDDGIDW